MTDISRLLPWAGIPTVLALLAALAFLILGLIAYLSPVTSAGIYGVPLEGGQGRAFVRAMGARNIGLSLLAIGLVALDLRGGLAALLLFAGLIAALDASIVTAEAGLKRGAKHVAYMAGLIGFGLWFATRV